MLYTIRCCRSRFPNNLIDVPFNCASDITMNKIMSMAKFLNYITFHPLLPLTIITEKYAITNIKFSAAFG